MVNLLCSPPGSGKSEYIYNGIKEKLAQGESVILLVPEQEAVIAETALTKMLDGANSMRLEVLNFKRLCNRVFREYGGLLYNYINGGGQAVIMWRVLSELSGSLSEINVPTEVDEALTQRILALYKSFKACRISDEMLAGASASLKDKLARKTEELASVFSRYKAVLGEDYDDACDDLDRLYDALCTYDFFAGKCVYFDSFYDFTAQELAVIGEIVRQAKTCTFSLEYDTRDGAVNYLRPKEMRKALLKISNESGKKVNIITETSGRKNGFIAYAADKIWDHTAPVYTGESDIEVYSCNGKYEEAQTVSAKVAKLVREGLRYREIAVIARSMTDYEGIIDVALRAKGIPCHISQRNRLALHPAVRAIFGALDIISHNWQSGDVIAYLKTGLTPLDAKEVNMLASYIRLWNIKGKRRYADAVWNMNPYGHTAPDPASDVTRRLDTLNSLRDSFTAPLISLADDLSAAESSADTARAIYRLMLSLGLDQKLNNYEGHIVWNTLCEALEQYADCAELCRDGANVSRVFHMIVASTDIGNIPSYADEVTCGSADMIRLSGIKHVIIMGVNEGGFPRRIKDDSFFTAYELEELSKKGITLPDGIDLRANDEHFFFMKALSFASQGLTLTYCEESRSEAASRICTLFDKEASDASALDGIEKIYTVTDALFAQGTTADPLLKDALSRVCTNADNGEVYLPALSESVMEKIYPGDMSLTQSRIKSFNSCPLCFRCKYDLGIPERAKAKLIPTETGTFIHAVFENTLRKAFCGDHVISSQAEMEAIAEGEAKAYVDRVCGSGNVSARIYEIFADLTRTAVTLAGSMYREFSASSFRPVAFEAGIGTKAGDIIEPFYIPVDDSRRAMIYGQIDRVDMLCSGEDAYLRIIDYKSGKDEFSKGDIAKGDNLQMPLYLLSLMKNENPLFREKIGVKSGIIPAGFMYYRVADAGADASSEDISDFSDERYIDKYISRSGVYLDEPLISTDAEASIENRAKLKPVSLSEIEEYEVTVGESVRRIAQGILSGDCSLSADPKKSYCDTCQYRCVCRRKEDDDE